MTITRKDFDAVLQKIREDNLRRGDLPMPAYETLEAYFAGKLPENEAAPMREFLIENPEVAKAMIAPFPGEGDYLSREEMQVQWDRLAKTIHAT